MDPPHNRIRKRQHHHHQASCGTACSIGSLLVLFFALSTVAFFSERRLGLLSPPKVSSSSSVVVVDEHDAEASSSAAVKRLLRCQTWKECQVNLQKLLDKSQRQDDEIRAAIKKQDCNNCTAEQQQQPLVVVRIDDLRYAVSVAEKRIKNIISIHPPLAKTAYQQPPQVLTPQLTKPPKPEWSNLHFPDITIAGLPKAGSSQLSHILTSHPDAKLMTNTPEYYFDLFHDYLEDEGNYSLAEKRDVQNRLYQFFDHDPVWPFWPPLEQLQAEQAQHKLWFATCFFPHDNILRARYLHPITKPIRFVFLLRDPADWLWSAWNFWTDVSLDSPDKIPNIELDEQPWVNASSHYRSPQLFHELVIGNDRVWPSANLLDSFRVRAVEHPRKLIAAFGRESILFLRNQDLQPRAVAKPNGLLDQLSNFTGLSRSGFDDASAQTIHNCNNHKGKDANCGSEPSSAYATSGNRSMLPETRRLVYLYFAAECKIWKEEFGMEYPECLNALPEAQAIINNT